MILTLTALIFALMIFQVISLFDFQINKCTKRSAVVAKIKARLFNKWNIAKWLVVLSFLTWFGWQNVPLLVAVGTAIGFVYKTPTDKKILDKIYSLFL